ncbi:MAG TPA: hypothetical protein VKU87_05965 [Thermomicrobiaceae bacterium]|nr:hypothetical protein [Thermomicrobiaceae bacterium]
MQQHGTLDFAGGVPVEMASGFSAFAAATAVGARKDYGRQALLPHNALYVLLGAGLLWFGWFGFNGGSALAANGIAAHAFVNTDVAGSVAMCTWLFIAWLLGEARPSLIGVFTGAVAGLATVTPAAGYIPTWAAFIIGIAAAAIAYGGVKFKTRMKWDDALDVWAAHGLGGGLGTILVGVFASVSINATAHNGLIYGGAAFFGKEVGATALIAAYAFGVTWLILKVLNHFQSVRVPDSLEQEGLDTEFAEPLAYILE